MEEISQKEGQVKIAILENLAKERKRRAFIILGTAVLFLAIRLVIAPFPYFSYIAGGYLLVLFLLILAGFCFKKDSNVKTGVIRFVVGTIILIELLALGAVLYLFIPVAQFYEIRISMVSIPFFLLYAVLIYPLLISKRGNDFFCFFSFSIVAALSALEYLGLSPVYPDYPATGVPGPPLYMAIIPIIIAVFVFLTTRSSMEQFWGRFGRINLELRGLNVELEEKVKERTIDLKKKSEELKEANSVLEVKVVARTRELKEFAEGLEENIKLRTKELQERVDELETLHKLTVGRELKMIELKKEIENFKKELTGKNNAK